MIFGIGKFRRYVVRCGTPSNRQIYRKRVAKVFLSSVLLFYVVCFSYVRMTRKWCEEGHDRCCEIYPHNENYDDGWILVADDKKKTPAFQELNYENIKKFVMSGVKIGDFRFLLNSRVCADDDVYLLVVVPSSPQNVEERQAIRDTWGSQFNINTRLKLVFMTGLTPKFDSKALEKEHEIYGDIVQADFLDSYHNLTLKIISMLQWTKQFCPQTKFLMKIDDDMYLQTDNLLTKLNFLKNEARFILGYTGIGEYPDRNLSSKWYVSETDYPFEKLPVYTHGPAYVISSDLFEDLLETVRHKSRIHLEDVLLTGLSAHLARATHIGRCGFGLGPRTGLVWYLSNAIVTAHEYSPVKMRRLWADLNGWKDYEPVLNFIGQVLAF